MRALAASERITLENKCERRVEQSMGAPGLCAAWPPGSRLCQHRRSIARHGLHASSMLTRGVQRWRILSCTRPQKWYRASPDEGAAGRYADLGPFGIITTLAINFLQCECDAD